DATVEENNLNQSVSMLRRALGESRGENRYIVTIPGRGYQFVADVRTIAERAAECQRKDQLMLVLEPPNSQATSSLSARQNRLISLVVLALLAVVIGIGLGVWWPQTRNLPVRKIAVLPFKPISTESGRDESLEFG